MLKNLLRIFSGFGIQPKLVWTSLKGWPYFRRDLHEIRKQLKNHPDFKIESLYPVLRERFETNGDLKSHYFYEDLSVARRVFDNQPSKHVDVGSRVDGFVAHIASFREIEVFDIRPQQTRVRNIRFVTADLMNLDPSLVEYTDSLSSLNVIEHFGLGRYGDPIDVNGHVKGLENMKRMLRKGGTFYFSTPIGPQRIEFNAHRVFSLAYLLKIFKPDYSIRFFSYVDDAGEFHENVTLTEESISTNFGCRFGFGIFEMTKLV